MKKLIIILFMVAALAACGGEDLVETAAQAHIDADDIDATITHIIEGNPAAFGSQELYCVATDATNPSTQLPYLLVVYDEADSYTVATMQEGYYEWDQYECPRPEGE